MKLFFFRYSNESFEIKKKKEFIVRMAISQRHKLKVLSKIQKW